MYYAIDLFPLDNIHCDSRCITPLLFLYFGDQCLYGDKFEIPFCVWSTPDNDIWFWFHTMC